MSVTALISGVIVVVPSGAAAANDVTTDLDSLMVTEYANEFNVSRQVATERLSTQEKGWDLVDVLSRELRDDFGGVWFDNKEGRFHVAVTTGANRSIVDDVLAERSLADETDIATVHYSANALASTTSAVTADLTRLKGFQIAMVGTDTRSNKVVVEVSTAATATQREEISEIVSAAGDRAEIVFRSPERFQADAGACTPFNCDQPLRGGVAISAGNCTAGFMAYVPSTGARLVLTAGHCLPSYGASHSASYANGTTQTIGPAVLSNYYQGSQPDMGAIAVTGPSWANPIQPWIAAWSSGSNPVLLDEDFPIAGWATEYQGMFGCRYGRASGYRCGDVDLLDVTLQYLDGIWVIHMTRSKSCLDQGDSGGPWISIGNLARGLSSGSAPYCSAGGSNPFLYTTPIGYSLYWYGTPLITTATGPK